MYTYFTIQHTDQKLSSYTCNINQPSACLNKILVKPFPASKTDGEARNAKSSFTIKDNYMPATYKRDLSPNLQFLKLIHWYFKNSIHVDKIKNEFL